MCRIMTLAFVFFASVVFAGGIGQIGWSNNNPYGELSAEGVYSTVTITAAGEANKVQITVFDTNGISNRTLPNHTTDDITIVEAGVYRISCIINADSVAGPAVKFGISIFKNNGATQVNRHHVSFSFSGGGGEARSHSMTGIAALSVNDTVEAWVWNYAGTEDIVIDDISISLDRISD